MPVIIFTGRLIAQIAVNAATRAAAARIAAAQAARTVVRSIHGRITSDAARRCYWGAPSGGAAGLAVAVQQRGDGSWWISFNGNAVFAGVSAFVAQCVTNARMR